MAICEWCEKEMLDVDSCIQEVEFPDGTTMQAVPYDPYHHAAQRCPDCGVKGGGLHHPGCDMERCPKCEGQLITCGCLDKENI